VSLIEEVPKSSFLLQNDTFTGTDTIYGQKPQAMEWASRIDRALYVRDIASAKERSKEKQELSKKDRKKEEKLRQKERKQIEAEQYAAYRKRINSDAVKIHVQVRILIYEAFDCQIGWHSIRQSRELTSRHDSKTP